MGPSVSPTSEGLEAEVSRLMTKPQERLDTKTWGEDSTHAVPHQWKLESVLSSPPREGTTLPLRLFCWLVS